MKHRLILKDPNTGVITRTTFNLTPPEHTFLGDYHNEEIISIQTCSDLIDNKGIEICDGDHLYIGSNDGLVFSATVEIHYGEFCAVVGENTTPLRMLKHHTLIVVGNIWGTK